MPASTSSLAAAERKRSRRQRRWSNRFALGGLLVALTAGAWAFDAQAPASGLKGILPEAPPSELAIEAFEPLGKNWTDWSQGTADAIADFYKLEGDAAAQREQLAVLKSKLGVMDRALKGSQYASIHDTLVSLHSPLARRVAVAEAILDTLETDPQTGRRAALKARATAVSSALSALEADVRGIPGGTAWLTYLKANELKAALGKSADDEATLAALNTSKTKLAKRETLTDESQKQFLSREAFLDLEAAIDAQIAAIEAPPAAESAPALRDALQKLIAAIEDYEVTSSIVAAKDARAAWKTVKQLAPDGGARLEGALGVHYFNYNVRIVASESFLSKLLADSRVEQGQVVDNVLGANVGGWQTTSTNVSVDLKPANDRVRFDLVLNGVVQSNTAGATSEATIYTSGYHVFNARKEVTFDGKTFRTIPATISVNANNTTTGATTRYSGGLFGGIANRIALREAEARRPQSQAIAASRVQGRVLPPFDSEVNQSFADASEQIDKEFTAGLKATDLYPDAQSYQTTDSALRLSTRLMGANELGGDGPEPRLLPESSGATLVLHESLVNNAIDRIGLAGKKMTEEELRHHVEAFLSKALSREFKFSAPEAQPVAAANASEEEEEDNVPSKLVFAEQDPLRVQFQNGILLLVIRAGIEREGKEPIPIQEISAPIRIAVEGDQIRAFREGLEIAGVEGDLSPVQRRVVNSKVSKALPERTVSAKFDLEGTKRTVQAQVARIRVVDGWISVAVR